MLKRAVDWRLKALHDAADGTVVIGGLYAAV